MSRRCLPTLIAVIVSTLGSPAVGERPSRSHFNAGLEQLREAVCAAAEVTGHSYRPFVCEAECCLSREHVESAVSCQETSPGRFELEITQVDRSITCTSDYTWVFAEPSRPTRLCSDTFPNPDPFGVLCAADSDCENGAVCLPVDPTVFGEGFSFCVNGPGCVSDDECWRSTLATVVLSPVTTPDSPEPVVCEGVAARSPVNGNDALECLAQVEAVIGQPCTRLP